MQKVNSRCYFVQGVYGNLFTSGMIVSKNTMHGSEHPAGQEGKWKRSCAKIIKIRGSILIKLYILSKTVKNTSYLSSLKFIIRVDKSKGINPSTR